MTHLLTPGKTKSLHMTETLVHRPVRGAPLIRALHLNGTHSNAHKHARMRAANLGWDVLWHAACWAAGLWWGQTEGYLSHIPAGSIDNKITQEHGRAARPADADRARCAVFNGSATCRGPSLHLSYFCGDFKCVWWHRQIVPLPAEDVHNEEKKQTDQ